MSLLNYTVAFALKLRKNSEDLSRGGRIFRNCSLLSRPRADIYTGYICVLPSALLSRAHVRTAPRRKSTLRAESGRKTIGLSQWPRVTDSG